MKYEKFDVEAALAGEPVILRNGLKAYVRYKEEDIKLKFPLMGVVLGEPSNGEFWTMRGTYYSNGSDSDQDIMGMHPKEPLTMPDSFWDMLTPEMVAIAKDGSGRWFCYSHEPAFRIEDDEWEGEDMTKGYALSTFNPEILPDCEPKDSLILRPHQYSTVMTNSELQKEIKAVKLKINNFELNPDDSIDSYEEMLDDRHGHFMGIPASRILKEVDPTAYRRGLLEYVNGMSIEDSEEYKDYLSQLEELEDVTDE